MFLHRQKLRLMLGLHWRRVGLREKRIGELASEDPFAALDEQHPVLVKHLARLIREEERAGGQPSRNVTDRIRVRQLTERLVDWRAAHGMMDVADDFFATLDERIAAVHDLMPGGPLPVIHSRGVDQGLDEI